MLHVECRQKIAIPVGITGSGRIWSENLALSLPFRFKKNPIGIHSDPTKSKRIHSDPVGHGKDLQIPTKFPPFPPNSLGSRRIEIQPESTQIPGGMPGLPVDSQYGLTSKILVIT